jgi:two-component system response regulator
MIDPVEILLVEDDPADVDLLRETMAEWRIVANLHTVEDGMDALAFLRREGPYAEVPRPELIFLDLNLPGVDGREVLAEIKTDHDLKQIPVVVFTTSQEEKDIDRCYLLGANCFITKPVGLAEYSRVVKGIEDFWLTIVRLPGREYRHYA